MRVMHHFRTVDNAEQPVALKKERRKVMCVCVYVDMHGVWMSWYTKNKLCELASFADTHPPRIGY